MARRALNENGCSDKDKLKGEFMYATLDVCKDFCKGTRFLQYHESTYCGCFLGCDFKRPASEYDSKADVYILEFWYDIINKNTQLTLQGRLMAVKTNKGMELVICGFH